MPGRHTARVEGSCGGAVGAVAVEAAGRGGDANPGEVESGVVEALRRARAACSKSEELQWEALTAVRFTWRCTASAALASHPARMAADHFAISAALVAPQTSTVFPLPPPPADEELADSSSNLRKRSRCGNGEPPALLAGDSAACPPEVYSSNFMLDRHIPGEKDAEKRDSPPREL